MEKWSALLEREFERTHRRIMLLSQHWREHTNRRTIVAVILGGAVIASLYILAIQPPENFPTDQLFTVTKGEKVPDIAKELQEAGVIRSPLAFRVIVKLSGRDRDLHAGDYLFKEPKDVFAVARAITIGAYGLEPFRIRIHEGATTKEMASLFARVLQRFDSARFLQQAASQEGYLFPDTYFFLPNATEGTVIEAMQQAFDTQTATFTMSVASSGHSLADVVIMASILEREGRGLEDRRMIAGVLWRRLKIGMALQADATMIYTLERGEPITPKVLATESPYNTYLHRGLPPTPIGSPSLTSLEAALTPIDKGYLFYLADSSGVTHFSKNYAGQLANQRKY